MKLMKILSVTLAILICLSGCGVTTGDLSPTPPASTPEGTTTEIVTTAPTETTAIATEATTEATTAATTEAPTEAATEPTTKETVKVEKETEPTQATKTEEKVSSSSSDFDIMVWIPTKGGKKYHSKATCSNMSEPDYVTIEEAERLGFTPCKKCYK